MVNCRFVFFNTLIIYVMEKIMTNVVRVGTCQTSEIIGEPLAALDIMLRFAKEADDNNVDLLLFPECFLTGYILNET